MKPARLEGGGDALDRAALARPRPSPRTRPAPAPASRTSGTAGRASPAARRPAAPRIPRAPGGGRGRRRARRLGDGSPHRCGPSRGIPASRATLRTRSSSSAARRARCRRLRLRGEVRAAHRARGLLPPGQRAPPCARRASRRRRRRVQRGSVAATTVQGQAAVWVRSSISSTARQPAVVAAVAAPVLLLHLPALGRVLLHGPQPPPLLLPRDVQEELHHHLAVVGQPALELVDLLVGGLPPSRFRASFSTRSTRTRPYQEWSKSGHVPVLGQPHLVAPEEVVALLELRGRRAGMDAEGPRVEPLGEPLDDGALAGGVPALEDHHGGDLRVQELVLQRAAAAPGGRGRPAGTRPWRRSGRDRPRRAPRLRGQEGYGDDRPLPEARMPYFDLDPLLETMLDYAPGISDLNLSVGRPPQVELDGQLKSVVLRGPRAAPAVPHRADRHAAAGRQARPRGQAGEDRLGRPLVQPGPAHALPRQRVRPARHLLDRPARHPEQECPTVEELGIPPQLNEIANERNGIVLVTGPTGSGKSTTLAAIINKINQREGRPHHHDRGPDRVPAPARHVDHQPARGRRRHPDLRPRPARGPAPGAQGHPGRARCATWRRSRSPSRPRRRATSCSRRCTRSTPPRPSTASSACSRRTRSARCAPASRRPSGGW